MGIALFDLDNTLIAGDSDYLWGCFLVEQGIVDGANAAASPGEAPLTLKQLLGWNGYPEMVCQWWPAVLSEAVKPEIPLLFCMQTELCMLCPETVCC